MNSLIKLEYFLLLLILILTISVRVYSASHMGWLAEDVFFIDNIDTWFLHNFWDYFFQFQHHSYPPRSPEFGTPPLGMWLQTLGIYISTLFGGTYLFGARLASIAASTITTLFIFKIGKIVFDTRAGLLSATLVALTPSIIAIDSSAHVDAILAMFLTVGLYWAIRYIQQDKSRYLHIASVFLGLGALVKVYAWFVIATIFIFILLYKHFVMKIGWLVLFRSWVLWSASLLIIIIPPVLWAGYRDIDHIGRTLDVVLGIGSLGTGVGTGGLFSEYAGVEGYEYKPYYYNMMMLYGRSLPFVSFAIILAFLIPIKTFFNRYERWFLNFFGVLIISFFTAIHFLGGPKALFNRILFPSLIFTLIAGTIISRLSTQNSRYRNILKWLPTLCITSAFFITFSTNPHFYNAYNNLLVGSVAGGSKFYRVGHGEGLELAAEWINENSPKDSLIFAPRVGFIDKYLTERYLTYAPLNEGLDYALAQGADYVVLHNSFFSGGLVPPIDKELSKSVPIHNITFQNYPYIRIYKIESNEFFEYLPPDNNTPVFRSISTNSKNNYISALNIGNATEFDYAINNNTYAFIQYDIKNVPTDADGLNIQITSKDTTELNVYIDIGKAGVGYYRFYTKKRWAGQHDFYIPFELMDLKYSPYNIYESDYLKISIDSYKESRTGNLDVTFFSWIKRLE